MSGPSLLRRYREIGGSPLATTPDLFLPRDHAARAILAETRVLYARFVALLVSAYDPGIIVLGGGLSQQAFYYQADELIRAYAFGTNRLPPIVPAAGGDASGKLGAAALVM